MLNSNMTIDHFDPAQYRTNLLEVLRRDLKRCRTFVKLCQEYIREASTYNDEDSVQMWANQQDVVLQEIDSIKQQLRQF